MTRRQALINIIVSFFSLILGFNFFKKLSLLNPKEPTNWLEYKQLIAEISEVLIPRTDTPGSKEAGVADFIIKIVENCTSERDQNIFLSGLKGIERYSIKNFSASFLSCSKENQILILHHFEDKGTFSNSFANKIKKKLLGPSFFEIAKNLTVKGYCTSEIGATQGLAYQHIPVDYYSCEPYTVNQRAWAFK